MAVRYPGEGRQRVCIDPGIAVVQRLRTIFVHHQADRKLVYHFYSIRKVMSIQQFLLYITYTISREYLVYF